MEFIFYITCFYSAMGMRGGLIYYVGFGGYIGFYGYIGFIYGAGSYLGGSLSYIYTDISPTPKSVIEESELYTLKDILDELC